MRMDEVLRIDVFSGLTASLVCSLTLRPAATIADLKDEAQQASGIQARQQRLLIGGDVARKLSDDEELCALASSLPDGAVVSVLLVVIDPDWSNELEGLRAGDLSLADAADDLRRDREAVLAAVESCGAQLQYASQILRADAEVALAAISFDPVAALYVSQNLLDDIDFCFAAVTLQPRVLQYFQNRHVRNDHDVIRAALSRNLDVLRYLDTGSKRLMLAIVATNGRALQYASKNLRADADVVLQAVQQDGRALQYAAACRRMDKAIVLAAVAQNSRALQAAGKNLLSDAEVLGTAVQQNGLMLAYASSALQANTDIVLMAGLQDYRALRHAAPGTLDSRPLLMSCIAKDGRALRFASKRLRADGELALKAFSRHKASLKYALKPAALYVVQHIPRALKNVASDLRNDVEIVAAAAVVAS